MGVGGSAPAFGRPVRNAGKVASYASQATREMGAPAPGTDFVFHSAESRCKKKGRADYTAVIDELIFRLLFHLDIAGKAR